MIIFEKVLGHERQKKILRTSVLKQAYLLSGPSGVGKKLMALATAQRALCADLKNAPCGNCQSCKMVESQTHPDLFLASPEEGLHKVKSIRHIQNFMAHKSMLNRGKTVIVDEAHKMNSQSANAFLKSLEEPPEGVTIFLIAPSAGALLPTVQSRCLKINFGILTEDQLKTIVPQAPSWAYTLSQGRADQLQFLCDETMLSRRQTFDALVESLPYSQNYENFERIESLVEDKDSALMTVMLCQHWLRSQVRTSGALPVIMELFEETKRLEADVQSNVNRKLAFENFWLKLKAAPLTRG